MTKKPYLDDLSKNEWGLIKPLLGKTSKKRYFTSLFLVIKLLHVNCQRPLLLHWKMTC